MKNKINKWIFKLAMTFIAKRLVHSSNKLTPEHLLSKGWVKTTGDINRVVYSQENIKDRDRIDIAFDGSGYRLWYSSTGKFIAAETSLEWFEMYYLLIHPDNGRYKLAGI